MNLWVSKARVIEVTGWNDRHVRRLAALGMLKSRRSDRIAPNGKNERDYWLPSLVIYLHARFERLGVQPQHEESDVVTGGLA